MAMIVDGVIIALLIGSIAYGYAVSRRVNRLMGILREMEPLVTQFSSAVDQSQESVLRMQDTLREAERAPEAAPPRQEPAQGSLFASRRGAAAPGQRAPGTHVVRDKKELVRAFFEQTDRARA